MIVRHKGYDITQYISAVSWSGSRSEVARKLEIKVVNAPLDENIKPLSIKLADTLYLYDDEGKELFRGFVVDREASSVAGEVTYVAYDILYYTLKSNATYNFSGKTAEAITKMVCSDMEIPVGDIASTGLSQKLIVQNTSIYEIIMRAYTQAYEKSGVKYYVLAKQGKLCVDKIGNVVSEIELTEDSNITSSKYKESLNGMVNKVRIYDGEGKQVGVVQNDKDLKYGIFQQTYTKEEGKDATTTAKSMFKSVEKTFTIEGINLNEVVTGTGVKIEDSTTGLSGIVWVDSDVHTWNNGIATMSLTVTLKKVMDTKTGNEVASSTSAPTSSASTSSSYSGSSSISSNLSSDYGSTDNPPFSLLKYDYAVQKNMYTWNEAYSQYIRYTESGKDKSGWKIVDDDGKEVPVTINGSKTNPPFSLLKNGYAVEKNMYTWNEAYSQYMRYTDSGKNTEGWAIVDDNGNEVQL